MKNLCKCLALALLLQSGFAYAADLCPANLSKATLRRFDGATVIACQVHGGVVPSSVSGPSDQVVALLDTGEGITIAIYATLNNKKTRKTTLVSMPIFEFSGLGAAAIAFMGNGKEETKLLVVDLDGDGLKEIAVVGVLQPSATLWLKTYDQVQSKFQDLIFRPTGPAKAAGPLMLSTGHLLRVPPRLSDPFVVSSADGKPVASYKFARKVD